jgi:hypothetical protein
MGEHAKGERGVAEALFDSAGVTGRRRRFAEDTIRPHRVDVSIDVPVNRGPPVAYDELHALLVRCLRMWGGVTVHVDDDFAMTDGRWSDHRFDVSVLAADKAAAHDAVRRLLDRALEVLEEDWHWFERNGDTSGWRPPKEPFDG